MVVGLMGMVKRINPVILNVDVLESGTRVFWVDRTINNLVRRSIE